MHGSIGKNDSNREMNLRAKPNDMNQVRNCHARREIEIFIHFLCIFLSFYLCTVIKVESVMASLWELGPVIFGPTEDFVSWLQNKGLLASS